jgi:hypothetical protein
LLFTGFAIGVAVIFAVLYMSMDKDQ